jgi:molybdenum cofactor cytidylyltransferase
MSVAAVVLAAGRGARLAASVSDAGASPTVAKPLLEHRGRPLVAWALDAAVGSRLHPVVLVVGHAGDDVARVAAGFDGVTVVPAPGWADGISQSLRAALEALASDLTVQAVCVGLADQPRVGAEAYRRVAAAAEGGAALAVATYDGGRGNPVAIGRTLWPAARALRGDAGARQLMDGSEVEVDCTGTGDPADVDTLDDLRSLEENPS